MYIVPWFKRTRNWLCTCFHANALDNIITYGKMSTLTEKEKSHKITMCRWYLYFSLSNRSLLPSATTSFAVMSISHTTEPCVNRLTMRYYHIMSIWRSFGTIEQMRTVNVQEWIATIKCIDFFPSSVSVTLYVYDGFTLNAFTKQSIKVNGCFTRVRLYNHWVTRI